MVGLYPSQCPREILFPLGRKYPGTCEGEIQETNSCRGLESMYFLCIRSPPSLWGVTDMRESLGGGGPCFLSPSCVHTLTEYLQQYI